MLTRLTSSGSVYCVADAGQKSVKISDFRPNFQIWERGSCAFTNPGQIWQDTVDPHAKFHLNSFIASPFRNEKLQFGANVDIWGLLYPAPFTNQSQIWYASVNPTVYSYVWNVISISLFCRFLVAKTPNFTILLTSPFCGVTNWSRTLKVNASAKLQTFPYTMVS